MLTPRLFSAAADFAPTLGGSSPAATGGHLHPDRLINRILVHRRPKDGITEFNLGDFLVIDVVYTR